MDKGKLRREIKRLYRESSSKERDRWSREICERLYAMVQIRTSKVLMAFYPLPDEADIRPLLERLYHEGKTVLLPEVTGESMMVLRRYEPDAEMENGALGTQVPATELFEDYQRIDTVLVPGVAFDKQGNRLGRGKGYYDRFLAGLSDNSIKIGVCFPYQMVDYVPTEEYDIVMDYV